MKMEQKAAISGYELMKAIKEAGVEIITELLSQTSEGQRMRVVAQTLDLVGEIILRTLVNIAADKFAPQDAEAFIDAAMREMEAEMKRFSVEDPNEYAQVLRLQQAMRRLE